MYAFHICLSLSCCTSKLRCRSISVGCMITESRQFVGVIPLILSAPVTVGFVTVGVWFSLVLSVVL